MSERGDQRQALVTGASSGIGRAIANRLATEGYQVFGVARRGAANDEGADARITSVPIDLEDLDRLPLKLDALNQRLGALDVIVLAAGRGRFGALEQQSYSDISALIDLNLTANVFMCRALLPGMKRRGRGRVVFIGSEAALQGKRNGSVYCATKFAMRGLAQALREECSKSGVAVSVIQPGMVRTPFFDQLDFEPGPDRHHALDSEQVADAVAYVLNSPAHAVIDEIELSPLQHVVKKRRKTEAS